MSKIPKGAQRELPEEGTHNAVCVQVIDLGTQKNANPEWGDKRKVLLGFELVDVQDEEHTALVSKQYTFSDSQKGNLMKDLKKWLNIKSGDLDMDDCLGKQALVSIEHKETDRGTFANISNISSVPKGTKMRKPQSVTRSLYLDETFDADVYEELPEWIRLKIATSPEYEEVAAPKPAAKKAKGKK